MIQKILLFPRTLLLKISFVVFLLIGPKILGQTTVNRIYTDWNGYWTSNSATLTGNQPNTENNLLAFLWNGKIYATGANNAALTAHSISFEDSKFRALKIQSLGYDSNTYFLQGSMIDGSLTDRKLTPPISGSTSTPAELASRLTDGINGLALGTGIANIKSGTSSEFKVGTNNIQLGVIGDGIPDIVVSQVAQPNSTFDKFKFVDINGNTIGNVLNVDFSVVNVMGTYRLDLFNANNGTIASGFNANDTRDIRLLAMDLTSFGITSANAGQIDRFVVSFSGSSDCAFIAFNANSLKIAELSLVKKASLTGCGKLGDTINYTFEVTNTGEVPITNITVTDAMAGITISGNPIGTLAAGAKVTLTGSYTITAADVAAGKVINSAKVTGTDPSLNTVVDLSGETNTDDTPTVINLLTPPTIGTITNVGCSSLGSVVLNDLPSTGTWTLEKNPGAITTTGSGTSTTIAGLAVGNYTFKVTNDLTCKSPSSSTVVITNQSGTTWNGTAWSNGIPDATKNAVFAATFPITTDLAACSCTINSGVTVTVSSGKILSITNSVTNSGGSLIFENDASLVQMNDAAVNTGKIIYKRISSEMKDYDYTYWSSPVLDQKLNVLSPNSGGYYYSFANGNWFREDGNNFMNAAGKGFIIRVPRPGVTYSNSEYWTGTYKQPVQFEGTPYNGIIHIDAEGALQNNLIGNPYPSAIDAELFIKNANNIAIINGSLYFWTHNTPTFKIGSKYVYTSNDYATLNLTGATATVSTKEALSGGKIPQGYIAAGQGFFVKSKTAGKFEFNNSMRVSDSGKNADFFKMGNTKKTASTEKNRVWLNLSNDGGAFKQILVGYIQGATNDMDNLYDGTTFNANVYIDFYSINNAQTLTIQGRALPFDPTDQVPLGYKSTIDGVFEISIDQVDGVLANQAVYLEDKTANVIYNLKNGAYSFSTLKGEFKDRFVLRYTSTTLGTDDFEANGKSVIVSVKNHQIKINSFQDSIAKVKVYDLGGRLVYSKEGINKNEFSIENLASGDQFLIVWTQLANGQRVSQKILLKN